MSELQIKADDTVMWALESRRTVYRVIATWGGRAWITRGENPGWLVNIEDLVPVADDVFEAGKRYTTIEQLSGYEYEVVDVREERAVAWVYQNGLLTTSTWLETSKRHEFQEVE